MSIFKGKFKGRVVLAIAAALALLSAVLYLIFGLASGTFQASLLLLPLAAALVGAALWFYRGFFADYLPAVLTALMSGGLILLVRDSIDDLTAFFVGMGDYFGNADNVGPRAAIAVVMLLCIVLAIVGSFLRQEKETA